MAPQPTRISFVRHGSVERAEVVYGRLKGYWLSTRGQQQARASAVVLASYPIKAIVSSPLLRSIQTAAAILEELPGRPLMIMEGLTEVRSPFEGQPQDVLEQRGYDLYTGQDPRFETPQDVADRMIAVVRRIIGEFAGEHVVAVSHGDPMAFTFLAFLGAALTPDNKNNLDQWGLPDRFPKRGSIMTLEMPPKGNVRIGYLNPGASPDVTDLFLFSRDAGNNASQRDPRLEPLPGN